MDWSLKAPGHKMLLDSKWRRGDFGALFADPAIAGRMKEQDRHRHHMVLEVQVTVLRKIADFEVRSVFDEAKCTNIL